MSAKRLQSRPFITLMALFSITCGLLLFTVDVAVSDQAGVKEHLPDTLDDQWTGHEVLFCQTPGCDRSWLARDIEPDAEGNRTCPTNWQGEPCGGELKTMSRGEYTVLPKDTVMLKKQYFHNQDPNNTVFTSVVLSGRNRDSIHRPEVCMVGQGNVIEKSEVIQVPLPGREPLEVMVLHLSRKLTETYTRHSYYAYWFVGQDRETPYHLERLMWMSIDRLLRNVTHRWAYIAVSGEREADLEDTGHYDEIREVVGKLYPEITLLDQP
ncbi:MAG: exosortase-associated EpsI family protein [Kiritimatiellae bacterium]|jgi:hypothetical protein|nr:exosortase-associated EpsI family protein [Kiritimatiellia bacterium]